MRAAGPILQSLLLVACMRGGASCAAPVGRAAAPPRFRLSHGFDPRTELTYSFRSELKQDTTIEGKRVREDVTISGTLRRAVARMSRRRGVALIGQIGSSTLEAVSGGEDSARLEKQQTWVSACRVTRSGMAVRREIRGLEMSPDLVALGQISESQQPHAPFPRGDVFLGSEWEGKVLLPLPGMRLSQEATSSVVAVRKIDGAICCIIRTEVSPMRGQSQVGWLPGKRQPDMVVTGMSECAFDIERGIERRVSWDLTVRLSGRRFEGTMRILSVVRLESSRSLSGGERKDWRRRTIALDDALARVYRGRAAPAISLVEAELGRARDADWLEGLGLALALISPIRQVEPSPAAGPAAADAGEGPALYKEAAAYAQAGELAKAVESYEEFLALKCDGVAPGSRVLARYRVGGLLLRLGQRDRALQSYRAVETMDADDQYSQSLKQKARERLRELTRASRGQTE